MRYSLSKTLYRSPIGAVYFFAVPIAVFHLVDSLMSYIFPIIVEESVFSNFTLGLIMGFSSLVGLFCDISFPQLIRNLTWKSKLIFGILISFLFPLLTALGRYYSLGESSILPVLLFLAASASWGVYFELVSFSKREFIVKEDKVHQYSKDWGIMYMVSEFAIIFGPIIGGLLIKLSIFQSALITVLIQIIGLSLAVAVIATLDKNEGLKIKSREKYYFNLSSELKYWLHFLRKLNTLIEASITLVFVESAFWTIGGLLGLELFGENSYIDWIVILVYSVPIILGGIIVSKLGIKTGKKRLYLTSMLLGGIFLASLLFTKDKYSVLLVVFLSSLSLSFAWPLSEAVFSDLLERLNGSKQHLIGLNLSTGSLAYILGPIIVGFLSDKVGYLSTLGIVGIIVCTVAFILMFVTPNKLQLPQKNIELLENNSSK